MNLVKVTIVIFMAYVVVAWLGGCSERKMYKVYTCVMAAHFLGDEESAENAYKTLDKYLEKKNSTLQLRIWSQQFLEDVPLDRHGPQNQFRMVKHIYDKNSCKKLYKQ